MAGSGSAVLLNWFEDLVVPVANVLWQATLVSYASGNRFTLLARIDPPTHMHRSVTTIVACSLVAELPVQRLAWALFAKVVGERLDTDETDERVQLANTAGRTT